MTDRIRSVDISKLTPEEAERISKQIGELTKEICDKAVLEANRLLNIYGMEAKMQIVIGPTGSLDKKPVKSRKTGGSKSKSKAQG